MVFAYPKPEANPSIDLRSWGAPAPEIGGAWVGSPVLGPGNAWGRGVGLGPAAWGHQHPSGRTLINPGWTGRAW